VTPDPKPTAAFEPGSIPQPAHVGGAYAYIRPRADVERACTAQTASAGALAGWTLAVKDLIAVAGLRLGAGSRTRAAVAPEPKDASVVEHLRRLGAVFVGTTTLHELAFGVTGINDYAGTPANPLRIGAIPGGSSSGSALAVAEHSARFALGTDTGGSVRIPAALCGVVGFKPAQGTYSTEGVLPLAPSLDHVGILARSVADVCAVHAACVERVMPLSAPPRVGLVRASFEDAERPVAEALERLLELAARRGCSIVDVALPDPQLVAEASTTIMFFEAALAHRDILESCPELLGRDVRLRLETGAALGAAAVAQAEQARSGVRAAVLAAFDGLDGVLGPTVGCLPPSLERGRDSAIATRLVANTRLANLVGMPAISLPVASGIPIGMQIMSTTEVSALATAAWIERLIDAA
jgi:Asp-tRNA(Asn)/Glu-tRNA(Gln) amidotransferase A subunit family amidase